jgi:hypothetical protein
MGSIWIALTDDWELRGNGMGSVYELQYLTSLKLMDLYDRLGVKGTFHLEVLQQIAFLKYSKQYRKIKKEAEYWREAVETMHREIRFFIFLILLLSLLITPLRKSICS